MGKIVRCITSDGLVTAVAIDSTDIVAAAEQIHKSSAVVTAGLGRLLSAASMMGCTLKNQKDSITIRVQGDGPAGFLTVVTDSSGNVKGSVDNPIVELPLNRFGKLDVAGAVGSGTLFVSKDLGLSEPYNGMVELVSGEIAEDITAYFANSEQIPTACALGVLVNPDLTVKKAGGFIIQLLPAAGDDTAQLVEDGMNKIVSVTSMLQNGLSPLDIVKKVLCNFEVEQLEELNAEYRCNCSRNRVMKILRGLGKAEIEKLAAEQPTTDVQCHFCNKSYSFFSDELKKLI